MGSTMAHVVIHESVYLVAYNGTTPQLETFMASQIRIKLACAVTLLLLSIATVNAESANESAPVPENSPTPPRGAKKPIGNLVTLPGIIIDRQDKRIDIEASICLDKGMLELIACTKGTKEHESIVAVSARPAHIHAALLLIGATKGNPAMRKLIDGQEKRWIELPPQGDLIKVSLVLKKEDEQLIELPISKFVSPHNPNFADQIDGDKENHNKVQKKNEIKRFAPTFLFSGSQIRSDGPGPGQYLADKSGNVISISTFGDELLCLPDVLGHSNASLIWQVNTTTVPKVGTKVILRLRPQVKPKKPSK